LGHRRRWWLVAPAVASITVDVALTFLGQSAAYWSGNYVAAVEANPLAHPLLASSPWLFVGVAAVWALCVGAVVLGWRHPVSNGVAVIITIAHAVSGSTWLVRLGPCGWVAAVAYLAVFAEFAWWCWRHVDTGAVLTQR
jgi:hypothetical protein